MLVAVVVVIVVAVVVVDVIIVALGPRTPHSDPKGDPRVTPQ